MSDLYDYRPFRDAHLLGPGAGNLIDTLPAALLVLPPASVIAHHTAATLYGFGIVPTDAVHVAVPAGTPVPQRKGVIAHECVLPFGELTPVYRWPDRPVETVRGTLNSRGGDGQGGGVRRGVRGGR